MIGTAAVTEKYIAEADLCLISLFYQALSEMYGRPIHIYCYSQEPINIFQHIQNRPGVESELNIPIRFETTVALS